MSTVKSNTLQVGQSVTATNNFCLYQPSTPDGTVRLGNGNSGSVTDRVTVTSAGYVGVGTSSPQSLLHLDVDGTALRISRGSAIGFLYNTGTSATDITRLQSNGGSVQLYTSGGTATLDGSGNLGLGVTPSGWGYTALQIKSGSVYEHSSSDFRMLQNAYYASGNAPKYINTAAASMYRQESGTHYWYNAPSGTAGNAISFTQAMTLDASGNLGVGDTAPTTRASIKGAMYTPAANFKVVLGINSTDSQAAGNGAGIALGGVYTGTASTAFAQIAGIKENSTDNNYAGALAFYSRPNGDTLYERARIDSSGNLLVGTTSALASEGFTVVRSTGSNPVGAIRNGNATAGKYWIFGPNSSNNYILYNNASTGVYLADGGTSWTSSSDERFKTDLKPIKNATQKVASLRAVTGRYKTDDEDVSRAFLIAQDVQAVLPEAVDASDPDNLGVQYTDTIPLLVAAIKELSAELNELKQRIN